MAQIQSDFNLPRNSYVAFDADNLKALIKNRLNENSSFTGQNFEASNMSAMIDVIAYSYHVLMFYLNQTATESMFSEAELYENMNRIVKSIDYKPIGFQTSVLTFEAESDTSLPSNTYTIPRYSFFNVGGIYFSFNSDVTFTKTTDVAEKLTELQSKNLLYQGIYREYPVFTAVGEQYETATLIPGDDIIIDHFNIDVYINDADTGKWDKWERTNSLYLEKSAAKKYEVRLNEHKRYELKFGNNNTGKQLNAGDRVAVYYLESTGKNGEIGPSILDRSRLTKFNAVQFQSIFDQIKDANIKYITQEQMSSLLFANSNGSSEYYEGESVEDIRKNAPKLFGTQHRLVTKDDYESYIKQNYSNIVKDVKVINNWDYIDGHMDYNLETLKLTKNNNDPRTLLNQVNFADSCDFNNLYCYVIPRIKQTASSNPRANYLTPAQKSNILSGLRDRKTLGSEIIITDPAFIAVDVGTYNPNTETLSKDLSDNSYLKIVRSNNSSQSFESIQTQVSNVIKAYFDGLELGDPIDVSNILNLILDIGGIASVSTVRTDTGQETQGLNITIWNPIFPDDDIINTGAGVTMPHYKYPYLYNPAKFTDKIKVVAESSLSELSTSEY
tara:strand:+ start:54 stop:1892 length:1839 start_codon:yes stop_codon:yes gene_type:complete